MFTLLKVALDFRGFVFVFCFLLFPSQTRKYREVGDQGTSAQYFKIIRKGKVDMKAEHKDSRTCVKLFPLPGCTRLEYFIKEKPKPSF